MRDNGHEGRATLRSSAAFPPPSPHDPFMARRRQASLDLKAAALRGCLRHPPQPCGRFAPMPFGHEDARHSLRSYHGARSSQPSAVWVLVGTGTRSCPGAARKHLLSVRVGGLQLISGVAHQHPAFAYPCDGLVVLVQPQDRQGPEVNQPCTRMRSVKPWRKAPGLNRHYGGSGEGRRSIPLLSWWRTVCRSSTRAIHTQIRLPSIWRCPSSPL